jgi:hypothetical protein
MSKLTDLPVMPFPPGDERREDELHRRLQQQGAEARKAGVPITRCPPFVDPDMAVDWQIGWVHEHECLIGKRDRKTGLLK